MASQRVLKVQRLLIRELSELLAREIKDPRLRNVTVVDVDASPDLRRALVFYRIIDSNETGQKEVAEGLQKAKGALKRMLGERIRLKFTPDLVFKYDTTQEQAERIEALLSEVAGDKPVS